MNRALARVRERRREKRGTRERESISERPNLSFRGCADDCRAGIHIYAPPKKRTRVFPLCPTLFFYRFARTGTPPPPPPPPTCNGRPGASAPASLCCIYINTYTHTIHSMSVSFALTAQELPHIIYTRTFRFIHISRFGPQVRLYNVK